MHRRIWTRKYQLDRMSHGELVLAYFLHPAIQTYLALAGLGLYACWRLAESVLPLALTAGLVVAIYPFAWYLLHRFVLHSSWLYRRPSTARLWKRVHFDHHRDPHDLRVLFGALYTTLPTVVAIVAPVGYVIGGAAGIAVAITTGLLVTCVYEYCHCIQHLRYTPSSAFLRRIKARHLQHHFLHERSNYGITSFLPDRLFGTFRASPKAVERSPTVFNLGYTGEELRRYPWVAQLTPGLENDAEAGDRPPERRSHAA